jgi:hypothetical protein
VTAAVAPPTVFHGVEEIENSRFYLIDLLRLVSCTTVTGVIDKEALKRWAAKLAAEAAFAELPTIVVASRKRVCGNTNNRCSGNGGHDWRERCDRCPCTECKACVAKWLADRHVAQTKRRADEGTRTHDVVEWWSYTGEIKPHDPDIAPYVAAFKAFVAEYGLTPDSFLLSEAIVVNREEGYAGTTDGIIRFHAARTEAAAKLISRITQVQWRRAVKQELTVDLVVDFKTKESPDPAFYPEQALQVTGYRHASRVRIKNTDTEEAMPATDGGAIVQLRPDGATLRLVVTDDKTYRRGFLGALSTCLWLIEDGPKSVSSHTFVLPETVAARDRKASREQAPAVNTAKPAATAKKSTTAAVKAERPVPLATRLYGASPELARDGRAGSRMSTDDIPF